VDLDGQSRAWRFDSWFRRTAKIRWAGSGRGKRGGLRVIYYWHVPGSTILFLLAYPKNEQDDLTPAQIKVLKNLIQTEFP